MKKIAILLIAAVSLGFISPANADEIIVTHPHHHHFYHHHHHVLIVHHDD